MQRIARQAVLRTLLTRGRRAALVIALGAGATACDVMRAPAPPQALADGSVVPANRDTNPDLFHGAIGGYGALGVISEVTLDLVENTRVKRYDVTMPITDYVRYFREQVRDSAAVVFHKADIYPNDYRTVRVVSYLSTDDPVTERERLMPIGPGYGRNRLAAWIVSEWPFGKWIRRRIVDPVRFRGTHVVYRNYEASRHTDELEPASRDGSTYVLQEYFVPIERFDDFVPTMRATFQRHRPNIINVAIRHARPDTETVLSWAPVEVFAFVVYYKQGTDAESQRRVGVWTRELIDAALAAGGSYYLPYQLHATQEQFTRAYPRAPELFALKRRVDPANRFRNMLWVRYGR